MEKSWRNDAYAKVTGKARYADDIKFPFMLHAVPVYSDFVHAKIKNINTEKASSSKGVVKIITHKDVTGNNLFGQIIKDFQIFAEDKIYYNGDVVAVVVAETEREAIDASKFVEVEAEILPSILDPEESMKPDALILHESFGTNIINTHKVRKGNVEEGFQKSDIILEEFFQTQFVEHAYMEPEVAVCNPRADGVIEVYAGMQHPFSTRRFTANLLGVNLSDIEIIGVPVGGGFGGKDDTIAIVCARTALAAKLTGKPVKMSYKRDWSIRESYKRHPYKVYYKMGISKEGLIKAVQTKIIADGGAYCSVTPWVTWRSTVQCCGPYRVPNVHCDTFGVYTNNVVTGAMRGFGSPQMNFVIESMIDVAAEKTGIPPVEFRKKNMVRQDSVTITGQKLDNHKVAMEEVLETALKESDYFNKFKNNNFGKSDSGELYGIGLAMSYRGMSLGAEGVDFCAAIINVQADGSILLETGIHENGQGSESAMCLILSKELGVKLERIRYRRPNTSSIPDSGTTVASRGTVLGGGATVIAVKELKKKITEAAIELYQCKAEDVSVVDDEILIKTKEPKKIPFSEFAKSMYGKRIYPYALGVFKAPKVTWDEDTGQGDAYFSYTYGCQVVELTVNKQTGKVKLLNAVAVHDAGNAINKCMTLGQFYGGIAMGTGYALYEDLKIKDGKIKSLNFNTYRIPRSTDLPEMKAVIVENADPNSPSGAKGIGEPTNELMAPAIANAIYNATGKRYFKLPIKIVNK